MTHPMDSGSHHRWQFTAPEMMLMCCHSEEKDREEKEYRWKVEVEQMGRRMGI